MVDEVRRTLGHPAASAAWAEAASFTRQRDQPIGATGYTPKAGKPMREHAAASESLKLALHEQGGATLVLTSIELPEEGLKMFADDAVEHPMLGRATHVRSRNPLARGRGATLHGRRTPSRLVPWLATAFFNAFHGDRREATWRAPSESWQPPPFATMYGLALPGATAANKPKALSAACGD
jgi:hypothetical protein